MTDMFDNTPIQNNEHAWLDLPDYTNRYFVSRNIGSFKMGQELKEDKEIASYFRECVDEDAENGVKCTLPDETIVKIVRSVDVKDMTLDDADYTRIQAVEKGPRYLEDQRTIDQQLRAEIAMAKTLDQYCDRVADYLQGETLSAKLDQIWHAKKDYDFGPVALLEEHLKPAFKNKIDELNALPIPGTDEQDAKKHNTRPDVYWTRKKSPTKGKITKVKTSVYVELAARIPITRAHQNVIDGTNKAENKAADTPAIYKRMKKFEREAVRKDAREAITVITKVIRQASWLNLQFLNMERLTKVTAKYLRDDKGDIKQVRAPIVVKSTISEDEYDIISVSAFLNLDIDKAIENGGTYEALMESSAGEAETPEEKASTVTDIETMLDAMNECITFYETADEGDSTKRYTQLLNHLNKPGSDDAVRTLYRMYEILDGVYPKIKNRALALAATAANKQEARVGNRG